MFFPLKNSIGVVSENSFLMFFHPTAFVVKTLFTRLYTLVDLLKPLKHQTVILTLSLKAGKLTLKFEEVKL